MKQSMKRFTAGFLAVLMFFSCMYTDVSAATKDYVYVEGTYMQTNARNMLNMINEFRQDSDQAWAWDETDSKKVYYADLEPLAYDYTLEQIAMQRAAELAIAYSHTRVNGEVCWTAMDEYGYSYIAAGENIAVGYSSAQDVFTAWREDDEPYRGQGHRRNMLSENVTHVGLAGVKVDGTNYWVQVFGATNKTPDTTETTACDTAKKVKIEVDLDTLTSSISASVDAINMKIGETADLPILNIKVKTADTVYSSGCPVTADYSWTYTGSGASISGNQLVASGEGTGTLTASVLGKTVSVPVTVKDKEPISACTITLESTSYVYDGSAKKPSVIVKNGNTALKENTDYTVSYENNTNAGTAKAIITGTGDYEGTVEKTFTIAKAAQVLKADVTEIQLVKGNSQQISVTGAQGALSYKSSNTDVASVDSQGTVTAKAAGSASITVSAAETDNYKAASITVAVSVERISISEYTVTLDQDSYIYDGNEKKPSVTIKNGNTVLKENTDYTVTYKNNVHAGTASVLISGAGEYKDSITRSFSIAKAEQQFEASVSASELERGETATITTTGAQGTVSYKSNNTAAASVNKNGLITAKGPGSAVITVTAAETDDYNSASVQVKVTVAKIGLNSCEITLEKTKYTYSGSAVKPSAVVVDGEYTLIKDTDYTVSYENNTNAGTAKVIITGAGDYRGTVEKTFTIAKAKQKLVTETEEMYLKIKETSAISVSGNKGALSFEISDSEIASVSSDGVVTAKKSGDAIITVTAAETDNYKLTTMDIPVYVGKISLDQAKITLSKTTYTYAAKEFKPAVTVSYSGKELQAEKDYTVVYSNNKNAGTATAAVSGIGEYTGTVEKTFTIKKADNKITASSQTKVYSTSKQTFKLDVERKGKAKLTYKSNSKKITVSSSGKVTIPAKFIGKATITITASSTGNYNKAQKKITIKVNPTKTSLKALSNPSAKKMKVTWKKNSSGTGYQIMYATDSKFTKNKVTKLIKKNGTVSASYSVKKGKTYYVKIRTYKTVNDVKYYSGWSKAKKIKITK